MQRFFPGAERYMIPESNTQEMFDACWGFVVHTMVDAPGPTAGHKYFERADVGAESTYFGPRTSKPIQIMHAGQRVDTQVAGNAFTVPGVGRRGFDSIEMEDDGNPEAYPFTDIQLDYLVELFMWYHIVQKVPARWCRNPYDSGFGFHSMWARQPDIWGPVNYRVKNPWSLSAGKTCPGNARVAQLKNDVWPEFLKAIKDPSSGGTNKPIIGVGDNDMVELWRVVPNGKAGRLKARPWFFVGPWGGIQVDNTRATLIKNAYLSGETMDIERNLTEGVYDLQRQLVEKHMQSTKTLFGANPQKVAEAVVKEMSKKLA